MARAPEPSPGAVTRTWPRHGRAPNGGAWRNWPLRTIVDRYPVGSATIVELLECGHAQYQKSPIGKHPAKVRRRRCQKCSGE